MKQIGGSAFTPNWDSRAAASKLYLGSQEPEIHFSFCLTDALRALAKIGFNLLAFHCPSTAPSCDSFERTVEWILEGKHIDEFGDIERFGFIEPGCVQPLNCLPKAHTFRLAHDPSKQMWNFYAAFFGGKAAAYVAFSGPSKEPWAMMDVVAPYDKRFLRPEYHDWYLPLETSVAMDAPKILPSIPWTNGKLHIRREPIDC